MPTIKTDGISVFRVAHYDQDGSNVIEISEEDMVEKMKEDTVPHGQIMASYGYKRPDVSGVLELGAILWYPSGDYLFKTWIPLRKITTGEVREKIAEKIGSEEYCFSLDYYPPESSDFRTIKVEFDAFSRLLVAKRELIGIPHSLVCEMGQYVVGNRECSVVFINGYLIIDQVIYRTQWECLIVSFSLLDELFVAHFNKKEEPEVADDC